MSESLKEVITEFNKYSEEMAEDIYNITNDSDIYHYKTLLKSINATNYKTVIEQFILEALPYKNQIISEDERFFLQEQHLDRFKSQNESLLQALKFKSIWGTLKEINKKNIFEYLQILVYYSENYLKLKFNI